MIITDVTAWIFVLFVRLPRSFGLCHPNLFVLLLLLLLLLLYSPITRIEKKQAVVMDANALFLLGWQIINYNPHLCCGERGRRVSEGKCIRGQVCSGRWGKVDDRDTLDYGKHKYRIATQPAPLRNAQNYVRRLVVDRKCPSLPSGRRFFPTQTG